MKYLLYLLIVLIASQSQAIICQSPSTYEIIYMNGEPVYPPIVLTEFVQGSEAKIRSDRDEEYFLLDMSGYTLMCFEVPFQPQGSPDYNSGFQSGEEIAVSVSMLAQKYTTGFLALRRKRQFFTSNSQFNLGFWNSFYLSLGRDFLIEMTPANMPPLFERGYGEGYSEALGKGKLIYESRSSRIVDQRKEDWYKDGYEDGYKYGCNVGFVVGYYTCWFQIYGQSSYESDQVYVHSYFRKDGTYVRSHYRSKPGQGNK